jgi:hypothetical protein
MRMTIPQDLVALDDLSTWPSRLSKLLKDNRATLAAYAEFEEHRYDGLRRGESQRQHSAAQNPLSDERAAVHEEATRILAERNILAWHCTRFTEDEIEMVQREGLRCLDRSATRQRIALRGKAGDLSAEEVTRLIERLDGRVDEELRGGKLWAVLSEAALTDETGLSQPLLHWGGEVLLTYENGASDRLRELGTACIVEFGAPISSAVVLDVIEPFLQRFLYLERGHGDDGASDACFDTAVAPHQLCRIIRRRDADFERLTNCSAWREEIT